MSDRDAAHLLEELQHARSRSERLEKAIAQHRWEMREYRGAFYDEALWQTIAEPQARTSDGSTQQTDGPGRITNHADNPQ